MHFYRRWQPVAAISFDLDDTLYDNGPAIVRAEQWMLSHLRSEYLATAMLDKPLVLHEANRKAGKATRFLGRFAKRIFVPYGVKIPRRSHIIPGKLSSNSPIYVRKYRLAK